MAKPGKERGATAKKAGGTKAARKAAVVATTDARWTQGALGAFGPLKKVASLRDPCPESPKMVGYIFYFMPGKAQDGRLCRPFWAFLGMK